MAMQVDAVQWNAVEQSLKSRDPQRVAEAADIVALSRAQSPAQVPWPTVRLAMQSLRNMPPNQEISQVSGRLIQELARDTVDTSAASEWQQFLAHQTVAGSPATKRLAAHAVARQNARHPASLERLRDGTVSVPVLGEILMSADPVRHEAAAYLLAHWAKHASWAAPAEALAFLDEVGRSPTTPKELALQITARIISGLADKHEGVRTAAYHGYVHRLLNDTNRDEFRAACITGEDAVLRGAAAEDLLRLFEKTSGERKRELRPFVQLIERTPGFEAVLAQRAQRLLQES